MKKNIISVGAVESKGLKVTIENDILKITKGSMFVMKGVRDRNLYYLKSSTITGDLKALVDSDDDTTKFVAHETWSRGEKFMQALSKQGLMKSAKTCKLKFCEHCVFGKKTKVKFGTAIHRTKENLDYVHTDV